MALDRSMKFGERDLDFNRVFSANMEMALQNIDSLRNYVEVKTCSGEGFELLKRMEPLEATERTGRYEDVKFGRVDFEAPFVFSRTFTLPVEIERIDDLFATIGNPLSLSMQSSAMGLRRQEGIELLQSFYRPIMARNGKNGVDGSGAMKQVDFDINNVVTFNKFGSTAADYGVTWKKLLEISKLHKQREGTGVLKMFINPEMDQELMQIAQIAENNVKVDSSIEENAYVVKTLNIMFICTNLIDRPELENLSYETDVDVDGVTYTKYTMPAFSDRGSVLGDWGSYTQILTEDINRGGNTKSYAEITVGATMTDPNRNFRLEFLKKQA